MSAIGYYAGLRPSKIIALHHSAIHLPHLSGGGWGVIEVTVAHDGEGNLLADTKTSTRRTATQLRPRGWKRS